MRFKGLKDKSTMSKGEYIFYQLMGSGWLLYTIVFLFEITVDKLSQNQSALVLTVCLAVSVCLGNLFFLAKRRSRLGVVYDLSLGTGCYFMLVYWEISWLCSESFLLAFFIYNFTNICTVCSRSFEKDIRKQIVRRFRLQEIMKGFRSSLAICAITLLVMLPYLNVQMNRGDRILMSEASYEAKEFYGEEYNLDRHLKKISRIGDKELWQVLDREDKEEILQTIINCEIRYLGIGHPVKLELSDDMERSLLGAYTEYNQRIRLNARYLDDNELMLNAIFHEIYHAYQYQMCLAYQNLTPENRNLYDYRWITEYIEEFSDYQSGGSSAYANQKVEQDARQYAEKTAVKYMEEIQKNFL